MTSPTESLLKKTAADEETATVVGRSPVYTGILPYQAIREMIHDGDIETPDFFEEPHPIEDNQIQPASIDLRLGDYAYPVGTSFLPGHGKTIVGKMRELDERFEDFKIPLKNGALLEKGRVYVIPLQESIRLKSDVAAFANPKSSTGRLDILTRLIADGASVFDQVDNGYQGQLYVEVAPRSFSIVAKTGARLNQLRFRRARGETPRSISSAEWKQLLDEGQVVATNGGNGLHKLKVGDRTGDLPFSVDLIGNGQSGEIIGWCSKKTTKYIDLDRRDYDPLDFWDPIRFHKESSLLLDPDRFYILMTREAIAVPRDYAAEMLPYDTRAGEFRVHYAGFFDPGFGWDAATGKANGSRGVLEVRSREVPFLMEHGQLVGWLRYERMAASPEKIYGQDSSSHYQGQALKLAKQFGQ